MSTDRDEKSPYPRAPGPLSPSRASLKPDNEPGVDALPDRESEIPLEPGDETVVDREMADMDLDSAELDDQPNPR